MSVCIVFSKETEQLINIDKMYVYQQIKIVSLFYWKERRKEGNVLFKDTLNTFYLQLYDVGHMVKDHSDNDRKLTATTS